jgi:phosphate transport system permease protein
MNRSREAVAVGRDDSVLVGDDGRRTSGRSRAFVQDAARHSLWRRRLAGRAGRLACALALVVGLAPLVAELAYTTARGVRGISFGFFVHAPTPPGIPGGGISTAIVGTAQIIGLALAVAVPVGLCAALFLYERPGRLATGLRFSADVLAGVPSIVIGIFAYALVVRGLHHFSDLAASFAIAVLMVPIMIRANEEAMRTVPVDLWEAGVALGARRSRVARSVVVRSAVPGLVSGNLLAVARGVGETAPLLFTVAAPTAAMTLLIFSEGTEALPAAQETAWATAFVLLAFVFALSVTSRVVAWGLTRRAR